MCGILGKIDMKQGIAGDELRRMLDVIRHRGPDDEGYYVYGKEEELCKGKDTVEEFQYLKSIDECKQEEILFAMGHRRLSIIDISAAGHQPMCEEDGRLAITFNGEIYNYIELQKELKQKGYEFHTNTDTEVILKAYQEWGRECVRRFNGMWAFAIFDKKKSEIFCSRDRLGAKPFYYYVNGDKFIFASEMKQICQDRQVKRKMNEKVLAAAIVYHLTDFNEETLLKDIFLLPGGCNLIVKADFEQRRIIRIEKEQYWDLKIPQKKSRTDQWYHEMKNAIRLRLRSDAPIGAMLSGGVDSSFIVGEISDYYRKSAKDISAFPTFTTCFENAKAHDETYYAHLVNESCGTEENLVYPDRKDTFEAYQKMIWHFEGFGTLSNLGSFMTLEEISKSGIKVLINGQGGDESMFGYERYYAQYFMDLLKRGKLIRFAREYRETVKHSKFNRKELLQNILYFGIPAVRRRRNHIKASSYAAKELIRVSDEREIRDCLVNRNFDQLIYHELRKGQLTHILRYDDRAYMAFSMESRVPFIDYKYLESAVNIEPSAKFKKGYTKYLVRKKMEKNLPDDVTWRTNKNGWSSPGERWVSRFPKDKLEDLFEHPRSGKYFDVRQIKKLYDRNPICKEFETFLAIETFMRLFEAKA